MDRNKMKERIIEICNEQADNVQLLENGDLKESGMNSIDIIKVIVAVENEFDIEFDEEDMQTTNFDTVDKLVDYVIDHTNADQ